MVEKWKKLEKNCVVTASEAAVTREGGERTPGECEITLGRASPTRPSRRKGRHLTRSDFAESIPVKMLTHEIGGARNL